MKLENAGRGMRIARFKDRYGVACSLQDSSLADEPAIWLGCHDADPKILVPGMGWQPVPMPEGCIANTRMHLTQEQVRELLPLLERFVAKGRL